MEETKKSITQEGADKAAEAYADNREISVQDGAGYPFKQEIMRAFVVGAAWQKQRLIDKACEWLQFCEYTFPYSMIEKLRKYLEEQQ